MRKIGVGLLLAASLAVFDASPAAAEKQALRMGYWGGPSHQMVQTLAAWIKTIEDASGGNLTVEVDKAGLAKMEGQYDLIRNGVRDLVWAVPGYTVGRFDVFQGTELPLLCPQPAVCSPAVWKWYEKNGLAAKEFTDTKLLVTFMGGPYGIHTTKPGKTPDELKTLKIRAAGPSLPMAKALRPNAVPLPATETYEAVQRGTVDGSVFPWEAMTSFRLNELLKGHIEAPGGLGAPTFVIVANRKAFDGLTPANQAALTFGDVVGRYFFHAPFAFTVELTQMAMAIVVYFGVGLVTHENAHISADVVTLRLPPRMRALLAVITNLLALGFLAVVVWRL